MPDGVCVVRAGLLKKALEVVHRRHCWMLAATRVGPDAPLTNASLVMDGTSTRWWHQPCRGWRRDGLQSIGSTLKRARNGVRLELVGTHCQLCGGDGVILRPLAICLDHPIGGEQR
jgi:hypothetical protein